MVYTYVQVSPQNVGQKKPGKLHLVELTPFSPTFHNTSLNTLERLVCHHPHQPRRGHKTTAFQKLLEDDSHNMRIVLLVHLVALQDPLTDTPGIVAMLQFSCRVQQHLQQVQQGKP